MAAILEECLISLDGKCLIKTNLYFNKEFGKYIMKTINVLGLWSFYPLPFSTNRQHQIFQSILDGSQFIFLSYSKFTYLFKAKFYFLLQFPINIWFVHKFFYSIFKRVLLKIRGSFLMASWVICFISTFVINWASCYIFIFKYRLWWRSFRRGAIHLFIKN